MRVSRNRTASGFIVFFACGKKLIAYFEPSFFYLAGTAAYGVSHRQASEPAVYRSIECAYYDLALEQKRICKGMCKRFGVTKPAGAGRYESGRGRRQACDAWLDYRGCRIKDESPLPSRNDA